MSRQSRLCSGILEQDSYLWCPTCQTETRHHVHYVAGLLHWLQCDRCFQRWDVKHLLLASAYCRMLPSRIATKPMRVTLEVRSHPLRFAVSLPRRVLTKPLRLVDEAVDVVGLAHQ